MLPAEIEHVLGFGDTADGGAGETAPTHNQTECRDGERFFRRTDEGDVAITAEEFDVGVNVVIGRDSVEDEVETAVLLFHLIGVTGDDDFVSPETERVFLFVWHRGEDNNVGSERISKLYGHVAQSP